ncbi:hypothetical protein D3C81_928590 [compost metagenome]
MGEQAQVDHRVFVGHFPDHEERQGHHRNHRADHDEAGFEPVGIVALVEHDLQSPDADDQRDQTDVIHRLAAGDHRALFHLLGDHPCREQADRHVDEENPRPAVAVGDPAAEDRPGNRRDHRDHRQQRQRQPPFRRGVNRNQQGLGHRVQWPGHYPLQHPEAHQLRHRGGNPAQERSQHEQQRRPDKQLHLAKTPTEPTGQRQGDGIAHGERGDDPGALLRTHAQVAGNRRQRHVGDGGVEHLHEGRQRQADGAEQQAGRCERRVIAHRKSFETRLAPLTLWERAVARGLAPV